MHIKNQKMIVPREARRNYLLTSRHISLSLLIKAHNFKAWQSDALKLKACQKKPDKTCLKPFTYVTLLTSIFH